MKISFHGAARTVTGSKHMVHLKDGRQILLDCGMFQGMGKETDELNEHFGFKPETIDAVLLSHAHIDHSGLLPKLVKEGYRGKIISTAATRDLTEILLYDSAEIQTYETEYINKKRATKGLPPYEPLYTADDVTQTMELFQTFEYDQWFTVMKDVEAQFTNAGHLVGSAAISLRIKEDVNKRLFYLVVMLAVTILCYCSHRPKLRKRIILSWKALMAINTTTLHSIRLKPFKNGSGKFVCRKAVN